MYLWDGSDNAVFDAQIRNLPAVGNGHFYTMWVTTETITDPMAVFAFNMNGAGIDGHKTAYFATSVAEIGPQVFSEDVWINVYVESDDGESGWQVGTPVLSGYLDR